MMIPVYHTYKYCICIGKCFEKVLDSFVDKFVTPHKNKFDFVKKGGCNKVVCHYIPLLNILETKTYSMCIYFDH